MADRRLYLLANAGLIALAASLILPLPDAFGTEAWRPLFDIAHLPVFGVLAIWLLIRLRARGMRRPGLVSALLIAGTACVVESIQSVSGRSGDLSDALTGIAGALIATTGWRVWTAGRSLLLGSGHAALSLGLALIVVWPSLLQIGAWWWQHRYFPMLGDFESSLEQQLWRAYPEAGSDKDCPGAATHGKRSLAVQTVPRVYSGVRYQANDGDWRGYDRLILDFYVPAGGPHLALRIDDNGDTTEHESRFNRTLQLSPGWNHVQISLDEIAAGPTNRSLDLSAIRQLLVFAGPSEAQPGLFCLDFVRIE